MRMLIHNGEDIATLDDEIIKLMENTGGKPVTVDITSGDTRSYSQNNLFQDATRYLAKFIAKKDNLEYDADVHTWIKQRSQRRWGLTREFMNAQTETWETVLVSTTKYSTGEMTHMITQILAYCAEIGVNVPIKGEYADLMESQNA